ncbi:MAG TPA: hypothetical protein VLZ03_11490, partial [Thermodesulfobacteriota bacterium]|nr:hypothetical protein [Thermodesulfobacteriota bacterium]
MPIAIVYIEEKTGGGQKGVEGLTSNTIPIIIMILLETFPMEKKIFLKWLVPLALTASLLFG